MKKLYIIVIILMSMFLLNGCFQISVNEQSSTAEEGQEQATTNKAGTTEATTKPTATTTIQTTQTVQTTAEIVEASLQNVVLDISANSIGNTNFSGDHYGVYPVYDGEYIVFINYMTMFLHGADTELAPEVVDGFEYAGEAMRYYNGTYYFLIRDNETLLYYLYSYDFINEPVKVMDSSVYSYEFVDNKIYFMKEFYQDPIYSLDLSSKVETQVTTMRAHSFVYSDNALYFYSTDAGNAPGLVKYDLSTKEETISVFPFYSHTYLAYGDYVYYEIDGATVKKASLKDGSVTDIITNMNAYGMTFNISEGVLYILTDSKVMSCGLDGSNLTTLYESSDYINPGLYIFGDRIYFSDGAYVYMIKKDGTGFVGYSLY